MENVSLVYTRRERRDGLQMTYTHTIQMQTPTHREKHNQSLNRRL